MGLFRKREKSSPPRPSSSATSPTPYSPAPNPAPAPPPADDDTARNALFGNRSASPPPGQNPNPYASNPYASDILIIEHRTHDAQIASRPFGNFSYAQQNNREDPGARNQLFSDRPQQDAQGYAPNPYVRPGSSGNYELQSSAPAPRPGSYGAPGGYSNSGERQLSAEEEEDEEVEAVKSQIRFTKQESVSSTRNALRMAAQAEETGRSTLQRLGEQGERMYNTEKNLNLAQSHNRTAEQKARDLKKYNGSMFNPHWKNPMNSKARREAEEAKIMERHQSEREEREAARQFAYGSRQHVDQSLKDGYRSSVGQPRGARMGERSKYQFEADEEDDEMENEIDQNLAELGSVVGRLHHLALATGKEADRQIDQVGRLTRISDQADDAIVITHNRIKKIR